MDPTAPKDNNQGPSPSNSPRSPIQPGQFVVASQEDVFKEPPAPQSTPPPTPTAPDPVPETPPQPTFQPPSPKSQPVDLASTLPSTAPTETQAPPPPSPQPNPTPYIPPPTATTSQPAQPSIISKLRKVLIVLVILATVFGIAAAVWFFVLGRNQVSQETQSEQLPIETPLPLPKRTTGGFAELQQATESGATSSADEGEEE